MKSAAIFCPGFRLSVRDVVTLVLGVMASTLAACVELWMGAVIGFTVSHFFLFCNVFRIARTLELIWAAIFLGLAGSSILSQVPTWYVTFSVSLLATIVLVIVQMRKPSYHGIYWKRINPNLPQWWEQQENSRK